MTSRLHLLRRARRSTRSRHGMSLLEILIALGIFLVAMTGIGQLVRTGSRASLDARLEAEAALRAESILQELLAGVQPLQSVSDALYEDDPAWHWTCQVAEGPHVDLLLVTVSAYRMGEDQTPRGLASLTRLTRDPQVFLDAALATP